MYNLECRYDSRKSFYGKAKVIETKSGSCIKKQLYSYGTFVASSKKCYHDGKLEKTIYECAGKYSSTTTRHQKEFFKQEGLNDDEIKKVLEDGKLECWED